MSKRFHAKYPSTFSTDFLKKAQISSSIKTYPVGAEFFYADRQTDMTTLIVAFRNFVNAPRNHKHSSILNVGYSTKCDPIWA